MRSIAVNGKGETSFRWHGRQVLLISSQSRWGDGDVPQPAVTMTGGRSPAPRLMPATPESKTVCQQTFL